MGVQVIDYANDVAIAIASILRHILEQALHTVAKWDSVNVLG